jgi:hypothetical protein
MGTLEMHIYLSAKETFMKHIIIHLLLAKTRLICSYQFLIAQIFTPHYVIAHHHLLQEVLRTTYDVQILVQHLCDVLRLIKVPNKDMELKVNSWYVTHKQ